MGEKIVSYRIESQPDVKGEETVEYPKEVDTQGEEEYDEEKTPVFTKKIAKKKVLLPEIVMIEPKARVYQNLSASNS